MEDEDLIGFMYQEEFSGSNRQYARRTLYLRLLYESVYDSP